MTDKKISLRQKADHSVVLPEANLIRWDSVGDFQVRFPPEEGGHIFSGEVWEPVPGPFELPTRVGAIVRAGGQRFIRASTDGTYVWVTVDGPGASWETDEDLLAMGSLETIFEGAL